MKKIFLINFLLVVMLVGCMSPSKIKITKEYYLPEQTIPVHSYDTAIKYSINYLSFDNEYIYLDIINESPHIYTPLEWDNLNEKPVRYDENNPDDYEQYYKHYVSHNGDYFFYVCFDKNLTDYYYFEEIVINDIYKSSASFDLETRTHVFYKGSFFYDELENKSIIAIANIKLKYCLGSKFSADFDGRIAGSLVVLDSEPYVGLDISFYPY